jgi:predicted exporter
MRVKASINPLAFLAVVIVGAALSAFAFFRITIDTDVVRSLPTGDPVIADGIRIFEKNPVKDRMTIDVGTTAADMPRLLSIAKSVERRLVISGLFTQVGNRSMQAGLTDLAVQVVSHLPVLFSAGDLNQWVAPLLTDEQIRRVLIQSRDDLYQMDGIGQSAAMAADPLRLRHIVLARLSALNPAPGSTIQDGRIVSADGCHLLILATPAGSGTDTVMARALDRLFRQLADDIHREFGGDVTITPTGAYRPALDNETIIKSDVQRAILWATIGIGVLLIAGFSRPFVGLMALLPALAGMVMAFFVFSLIHDSISIMVLGFGGAIVSITVDHGIAYLLFRERGDRQDGSHASREIRAVGLLAVVTSVGAFGVLAFSGFAVFEQLGLFTAMGIGFAFIFVHTMFPRILPAGMNDRPAPRRGFSKMVDWLASAGKPGLVTALVVVAVLAVFIRPHFNTDLKAMNSVSASTRAADELMTSVWGDIFSSVYLMAEADDLASLQVKNDRLEELLATEVHAGGIEAPVSPSLFFPGPNRRRDNLNAWKAFWTADRIRRVEAALDREGEALGFAPGAFDGFIDLLAVRSVDPAAIPPSVHQLLGITQDKSDGKWRQMTRIAPGRHFDGRRFFQRLSPLAAVFDPDLFSRRMGDILFGTFLKMLLIIGISLIFLLALFFADAGLLMTSLMPLAFAFVCTLGTLGALGRPLDIPALMLSVVILGMGVDYTLLMVRGYQRYQRFDHPHFAVVRTAIVMAAASTLVGFSVLLFAEHNLLKSAGLVSFLGIGFCLAGALLILPPLLKRRFEGAAAAGGGIERRYANMEPYPRLFARHKLHLDPLFGELERLLPETCDPANIIDVGSGYGVPACWLAERYPGAFIHGIEPKSEQVRVASLALGDRGSIVKGSAPDLPSTDVLLNLAIMLDMSHFLQDWELEKTFERIHERLLPGGRLIMRSVLPRSPRPHWTWYLESLKIKLNGAGTCYRDADTIGAILDRCGFEVVANQASGKRGDMWWHVAKPK